jgi:hypothetical protein
MLITNKMIKDWSKAVQVSGDRDRIVVGFTTTCAIPAQQKKYCVLKILVFNIIKISPKLTDLIPFIFEFT